MKFYYPDNMEAPAMIILWKMKDAVIIFFSLVLMVILSATIKTIYPVILPVFYGVLTITFADGSIYDSKSDYDKLRVKAIRDVKQTNGSIDILEAISESEENILT